MRKCDLADSPIASFEPDIAGSADGLRDYLREKFAQSSFGRTPASRQLAFELIDGALRDAGSTAVDEEVGRGAAALDTKDLTVRLLRLISRTDDGGLGMRATCFLRLLGEDGRSFQQIADDFNFGSRAAPHAAYRNLQKATGLRAPGDKSDAARAACRNRRIGKRRERRPWAGQEAWNKARQAAPLPIAV